jgi:ABC-type lipoprotein release transport system permease subunit
MTITRLAIASLVHYRRTHVAVALGVAGAVAVLAGSLLVGASVRQSLAAIATNRLGHTAVAAAADLPFTDGLAARVSSATGAPVAPLLLLKGHVRHESSDRQATDVSIYGVDARFFAFHGVEVEAPGRNAALLSPDLAAEFGAASGDAIVLRLARPTDIPLDSLHGRREDVGRAIRLTSAGTLARDRMGDFSLAPGQGPARAVFVSLQRLQRDLQLESRVNTLLVGGPATAAAVSDAISRQATNNDLGIRIEPQPETGVSIVESASGLVDDALAARVLEAASGAGRSTTPVLTWLATRMAIGDRAIPYSVVTALGPDAGGDAALASALGAPAGGVTPIVLTEWAAEDLRASVGDAMELEYYRWADEGRLVTERARFQVSGIVPMRGLAIDRRLAPDYPGLTTATSVADWDPPFPIDLRQIRPQDEAYWDRYRTAPKAFIPLAAGQSLWRTRHGQLTSLRVTGADPLDLATSNPDIRSQGTEEPITVVNVRSQNLSASAGATDFGAYFSYFSFFLMVSALLLSALFFRLSVEQRLPQVGVLRAAGFPLAAVRRALLIEGGAVALAGAIVGAALAVGWAAMMMYGLRTWWVGAVGTTQLALHVDAASLAIGASGAFVAAVLSIALTVRALGRITPRAALAGALPAPSRRARTRAGRLAPASFVLAAVASGLSLADVIPAAGGFFSAGALVLVGGLAAFGAWLTHAGRRRSPGTPGVTGLASLGARNASWRPGRSLTAAGLVAAAVFLLVSVDAFRKSTGDTAARNSGTGGFALIAESSLPVVHDLDTPAGRDAAGFVANDPRASLTGVNIIGLRLRPGDDASCLNLYQPKQPRILGVPARLMQENRFRFARVMSSASTGARANPWTLLGDADAAGIVPAIVDQTSLQYVLHAAVGDVITIDAETSRPVRLRVVASLNDSVLQGEILIGEGAFQRLFPDMAGFRVFLVAVDPAGRAADVAGALEEGLEPYGFDAQEARARLEAYHRVENTYLSTFQALGGLGLVLGCLGLVAVIARNVLERRRELALLGAAGYTGRDLQRLVAIEHLALVITGLVIGVAAAGLAIGPVLIERGGAAPWRALVWLLPVAAAGLVAAFGATRALRRLPLMASLRSE